MKERKTVDELDLTIECPCCLRFFTVTVRANIASTTLEAKTKKENI